MQGFLETSCVSVDWKDHGPKPSAQPEQAMMLHSLRVQVELVFIQLVWVFKGFVFTAGLCQCCLRSSSPGLQMYLLLGLGF